MAIKAAKHGQRPLRHNLNQTKPSPTLAFGNYIDRNAPGSPWGTCDDNILIRPEQNDGTPEYNAIIPLTPGYCTLSMLFTDWNKSGENALRFTNDQYYRGGQEQLWRVSPNENPRLYTANDGWGKVVIWGWVLLRPI